MSRVRKKNVRLAAVAEVVIADRAATLAAVVAAAVAEVVWATAVVAEEAVAAVAVNATDS